MIINENGWGNNPQEVQNEEKINPKVSKLQKIAKELKELEEAVEEAITGEENAEQE
jgi:hypothetical protein